jgi:hypothetical protein
MFLPGQITPFLQALETNKKVDGIYYRSDVHVLFRPLYNFIKTRDGLRKVVLDGYFRNPWIIIRLIKAVAKNPTVQSFVLKESVRAAPWDILCSHRN